MGYTHYWRKAAETPADKWALLIEDSNKLINSSPTRISFEQGDETPPSLTSEVIRFNAFEEDEAHETFLLERGIVDFGFCKTAGKKYDFVVCGILACAAEHFSESIKVTSDGDERDWADALKWAGDVLGRPISFPVVKD